MPDGFSIHIDLPDFRRQLAEIEKRVRTRVVRGAARDAARVAQRAVKSAAPVLRKADPRRIPGRLRESIVISNRRAARGVIAFTVVPRARKATKRRAAADLPFYWVFLEGGWLPRGPGQRISGGRWKKARVRAELFHTRVQVPFIEPAFKSSQGAVVAAFNAGVERRLAELQTVK